MKNVRARNYVSWERRPKTPPKPKPKARPLSFEEMRQMFKK